MLDKSSSHSLIWILCLALLTIEKNKRFLYRKKAYVELIGVAKECDPSEDLGGLLFSNQYLTINKDDPVLF